jgi:ATP-dependent Lhr-like helicase
VLLDRAGDLTLAELGERVATPDEGRRGDPLTELLERSRAIGIDIPATDASPDRRVILAETYARYAAAFGGDTLTTVYVGASLEPRPVADVLPEALRNVAVTPQTGAREVLARFLALADPVSIDDVLRRYAFDERWIGARLDDWTRAGKLVKGRFGGKRDVERWCSRRLLEQARRRELAAARKQIEAVELPVFAGFLQRWQHLDAATRLADGEGTVQAVRQLVGVARPAERWERDYLAARVERYDPDALTRIMSLGELVGIGGSGPSAKPDEPPNLATFMFVERGSARAWLATDVTPPLSDQARQVEEALRRDGASFFRRTAQRHRPHHSATFVMPCVS